MATSFSPPVVIVYLGISLSHTSLSLGLFQLKILVPVPPAQRTKAHRGGVVFFNLLWVVSICKIIKDSKNQRETRISFIVGWLFESRLKHVSYE